MHTFFSRLKEERLKVGLNQTEFAELTGVKRLSQSNYESGKRKPDIDYLALVNKLGCDVNFIVTGQRNYTDDFDFSIQQRAINIVASYIQKSGKKLARPDLFYAVAMEIYQVIKDAEDNKEDVDPIDVGAKIIQLFAA